MSQRVNIQTLRKKTMPSLVCGFTAKLKKKSNVRRAVRYETPMKTQFHNRCSGFTPTPIVESLRRVLFSYSNIVKRWHKMRPTISFKTPMKTQFHNRCRGFTLVEILVVVSIIAVMSTAVLPSFNEIRKKGRIAQRASDLRALQTTIEIYRQTTGLYPDTGGVFQSYCSAWPGAETDYIPGLAPDYIAVLPTDPQYKPTVPNNNCYLYKGLSGGGNYKLVAFQSLEMVGNGQGGYASQPALLDPRRDGGSDNCAVEQGGSAYAWAVYSNGARCE